ncbi:oligosaccharide flippase family protein [Micromonospora sp. STR1s_5]|nr:oligosaccharide flippase family protein [Micromonospora sp. STR1s_5]
MMRFDKVLPDAAFLYTSHFFRYVFPLAVVPFLARHLGPEAYGIVLTALSLTTLVAIIVEYGFGVSGARDIAASDPNALGPVLSGVLTAKLLLVVLACAFGTGIAAASPVLRAHYGFVAWAVALGIVQGMNMSWFFRAVGRTGTGITIDITSQLVYVVCLFSFVTRPEHSILVLIFQTTCLAGGQFASLVFIYLHTPYNMVPWRSALTTLVRGLSMFTLSASIAAYTAAGSLILALLAGPEQVGFFGPADRLVSAALQLTAPLSALLLPHMTRTVLADPKRAMNILRVIVVVLTAGAIAGATLAVMLAGYMLPILLGPGFEPSVPIFRALVLVLPLSIYSQCLAMLLLIPVGRDRAVTGVALGAGALNLLLAVALVPKFGAVGMACGRIVTEAAVAVVSTIVVLRLRRQWAERSLDGGTEIG